MRDLVNVITLKTMFDHFYCINSTTYSPRFNYGIIFCFYFIVDRWLDVFINFRSTRPFIYEFQQCCILTSVDSDQPV